MEVVSYLSIFDRASLASTCKWMCLLMSTQRTLHLFVCKSKLLHIVYLYQHSQLNLEESRMTAFEVADAPTLHFYIKHVYLDLPNMLNLYIHALCSRGDATLIDIFYHYHRFVIKNNWQGFLDLCYPACMTRNHIQLLKWLHEKSPSSLRCSTLFIYYLRHAASNGHLAVFQFIVGKCHIYLCEIFGPWYRIERLVELGQLGVIRYLFQRYNLNSSISNYLKDDLCKIAHQHNHKKLVKWCQKHFY